MKKIELNVTRGVNCFFSNLRDIVCYTIKHQFREYEVFFLSNALDISYHPSSDQIADNFVVCSLTDSINMLSEKLSLHYEYRENNRRDTFAQFIASCLYSENPVLLTIDSKVLNYQIAPSYLDDVSAKHIILVYGVQDDTQTFYAYDTYVYGESAGTISVYDISLDIAQIINNGVSAVCLYKKENGDPLPKCTIPYQKIFIEYLFAGSNKGIDAFRACIDDLDRLYNVEQLLAKQAIKELIYFFQIRYGFFYQYIEASLNDQCRSTQTMRGIELIEETRQAWTRLNAKMVLSTYVINHRIIQRIQESAYIVYARQKELFQHLIKMHEPRKV